MSDEQQVMVNVEYAAMLEQKVKELQSRLDQCELQRQGEYQRAEAYKYRVHLLDTKLAGEEAIRRGYAERAEKAEARLDAIRKIVEPTGAYLFSGHVNALAEIRALLVETQKRESGPASGYPEDFDNKWD